MASKKLNAPTNYTVQLLKQDPAMVARPQNSQLKNENNFANFKILVLFGNGKTCACQDSLQFLLNTPNTLVIQKVVQSDNYSCHVSICFSPLKQSSWVMTFFQKTKIL
jgi:hypothetical protein